MGIGLLEKSLLRAKYEWGNISFDIPQTELRTSRPVLSFYGDQGNSQITLALPTRETLDEIEFLCPSMR
jgi:hypothetical protein